LTQSRFATESYKAEVSDGKIESAANMFS